MELILDGQFSSVAQSCPTLCDPMNCSIPGLPVHHQLQEFTQTLTSLVAQTVKRLSTMRETRVRSLSWEDPLEKEMAIHSRTIAWKIPWAEEPGRLQSMGLQRVRHDWATSLHFTSCPLSWWCHSTISSFAFPFSSCPQSFPATGSFQMSQLFTSGGQTIGVSASN